MAVLITGGAGYIGSHMAWRLLDAGEEVIILDNLSTGHAWSIPGRAVFVKGDAGSTEAFAEARASAPIDAVIHFAGSVVVPESIAEPLKYYRNNTCTTLGLLENCLAAGVETFIFSSTAAVYADPGDELVGEDAALLPATPYGRSKLMIEEILADVSAASGLHHAILRYFNVAGADPAGRTGHSTRGATHLLKVACEAALGKRDGMAVFGTDYPTRDGTAERDFIHVSDLVEAHYLALQKLRAARENFTLNCGYGRGYSVLEMIAAVKAESGTDFPVALEGRREGDLARVVADSTAIRTALAWRPAYDDLAGIARHALAWERHLMSRNATESHSGE